MITETTGGLDQVYPQLSAQPADEHLDRVGVPITIVFVKVLHQLGAGDYPALMMSEISEKPIF
jgi:hypothetical protein